MVADDLVVIVGHRPRCDPDACHVMLVRGVHEGGYCRGVSWAGPPERITAWRIGHRPLSRRRAAGGRRPPGALAHIVLPADGSDQLGDAPLPRLRGFGVPDGLYVLALEAVCQAVEGGARLRVAVECLGQVGWFGHHPWLGVELDVGLHAVAFGDSAGGAVGCADADDEPPAHRRDPAAPGVAVDRDGNLGALAGPQSGDDLGRDLDPGGITGRFDRRWEPHVRSPFPRGHSVTCPRQGTAPTSGGPRRARVLAAGRRPVRWLQQWPSLTVLPWPASPAALPPHEAAAG